MIIYSPLDGDAFTSSIPSRPRHCFLMTRLGKPVPPQVEDIRAAITRICQRVEYSVIDATHQVTGRDILIKIWKLIAATPLSIGIIHPEVTEQTLSNIYYEFGAAQALGKEVLIVKDPRAKIPSDLIRSEYVDFDDDFEEKFQNYLNNMLEQAAHYELMADQLDRNPLLAMDYLKRAYLISGEGRLQNKAADILESAGLSDRAKNSVEQIAASF